MALALRHCRAGTAPLLACVDQCNFEFDSRGGLFLGMEVVAALNVGRGQTGKERGSEGN